MRSILLSPGISNIIGNNSSHFTVPTYPRTWTGRSVSPRTCLRRPRTPRSVPCRWRRSRSAWRRPGWRASRAAVRLPSSCSWSPTPEAAGRGPGGRVPGLRPRRTLALRAWWCRYARGPRAWFKGRGSGATELGSAGRARRPPLARHWPGGLGAGRHDPPGPPTPDRRRPPPAPRDPRRHRDGGKSFSGTVGKVGRWNGFLYSVWRNGFWGDRGNDS